MVVQRGLEYGKNLNNYLFSAYKVRAMDKFHNISDFMDREKHAAANNHCSPLTHA
jgi:hypothetical protein